MPGGEALTKIPPTSGSTIYDLLKMKDIPPMYSILEQQKRNLYIFKDKTFIHIWLLRLTRIMHMNPLAVKTELIQDMALSPSVS